MRTPRVWRVWELRVYTYSLKYICSHPQQFHVMPPAIFQAPTLSEPPAWWVKGSKWGQCEHDVTLHECLPRRCWGLLLTSRLWDLEGLALRVQMKHVGGFRPAEPRGSGQCMQTPALLPHHCHTAAAQGWGPTRTYKLNATGSRIPGFCLVLLKISANLNWQYFVHFYF